MKVVKLTYNFDWPLFRQTPASSGIWGDYQFIIDPNLKECDFWVIYSDYEFKREQCYCHPDNVIFLPAEGFNTSSKYSKAFLQQFGKVITVQRQIKGQNVVYWQNANPWFIERSYDELINLKMPEKTKLISLISSNKAFTPGHQLRLEFAKKLKARFGDKIDFFGRGIHDFKTKWEVTAPYKYQIVIENDFCDDWVTEKFFDPLLTFTYPVYFGCPNLEEKYMPAKSFTRINIPDFEAAVTQIERLIEAEDVYSDFVDHSSQYRHLALNMHQLFPMLVGFLSGMDATLPKKKLVISASGNSTIGAGFLSKVFSGFKLS